MNIENWLEWVLVLTGEGSGFKSQSRTALASHADLPRAGHLEYLGPVRRGSVREVE